MTSQDKMIGNSPEFKALIRSLQVAAATDVPVMLLGESGTGKELLARHLHQESHRKAAPFVVVNCATLPEGLAESELFGHRKDAFTGADNDNIGLIQSAAGGTLFLDEVAELPGAIQSKLLGFLESGEFQAVGDTRHQQADVRIVTATHADLNGKIKDGEFREDLYYHLNVVPFHVPALRERTEDIPLLINELSLILKGIHQIIPATFSKDCMAELSRYSWPGNIRELRNFCARMLILFSGRQVEIDNLPAEIRDHTRKQENLFTLPDKGINWEDLERNLIVQALQKTRGNQSKAARLLGLTRDTFLYRIRKYAIEL
jgi:DNA-binding NtrC family response regulator